MWYDDDAIAALALDLYRRKQRSMDDICQALGITELTLYRYVKQERAALDHYERRKPSSRFE
jgi:hypothetical protein